MADLTPYVMPLENILNYPHSPKIPQIENDIKNAFLKKNQHLATKSRIIIEPPEQIKTTSAHASFGKYHNCIFPNIAQDLSLRRYNFTFPTQYTMLSTGHKMENLMTDHLIQPFNALRPNPQFIQDVIAPPYDVINREQAAEFAHNKPNNILHVSKAEIDLPKDADPYSDSTYQLAQKKLSQLCQENILIQDEQPCYYLYQIESPHHTQTGLVCGVSVDAYNTNRVRKHEHTRPQKEIDRCRLMTVTQAQTGPVILSYPDQKALRTLWETRQAEPPDVSVKDAQGLTHRVWLIRQQTDVITQHFDAMDALYIADGHHRCAAAARVAQALGSQASHYFLAALFPESELHILGYHRVVRDLNGLSLAALLEQCGARYFVSKAMGPVLPEQPGEVGLYAEHSWYRLTYRGQPAHLDAEQLSQSILAPILGITDIRSDSRIDFVGGFDSTHIIEDRVNAGEMAVGFTLYPTQMSDIVHIADQGGVMPPKSTWFEPKLADGLFVRSLA